MLVGVAFEMSLVRIRFVELEQDLGSVITDGWPDIAVLLPVRASGCGLVSKCNLISPSGQLEVIPAASLFMMKVWQRFGDLIISIQWVFWGCRACLSGCAHAYDNSQRFDLSNRPMQATLSNLVMEHASCVVIQIQVLHHVLASGKTCGSADQLLQGLVLARIKVKLLLAMRTLENHVDRALISILQPGSECRH